MITKQLEYGITDSEVKLLQQWLNANGFTVATTGPGSPGNETSYFGPATRAAVQKFQASKGIVSSGTAATTGYGRVGPKTLSQINALQASGSPAGGDATGGGAVGGGAVGGGTSTGEDKKIPDWLKDNNYFNQLSPDDQQYMVDYYNILKINDTEKQKLLTQALNDAKSSADPYFKEKIRIAQDELSRALGSQKGDFESRQRELTNKINDIKADLATGKGRISIDEQAELARQSRRYEVELETLRESAASSGLTFSSRRAVAEGRLSVENQDIVESTKRSFQRKLEDLVSAADRGDRDARNQLQDYERIYGENVTKLLRSAESTLGTANVPSSYAGYTPLGGVTGSLEEDKLADITKRAEALVNLRNPFL